MNEFSIHELPFIFNKWILQIVHDRQRSTYQGTIYFVQSILPWGATYKSTEEATTLRISTEFVAGSHPGTKTSNGDA